MANYNPVSNRGVPITEDFEYKNYPEGVDLHPQSEEHQELVDLILSYTKQSSDIMQDRYDSWRAIDRKVNVYIDLSDEEVEDKADDDRRPVSMVVPLSYATRETWLTYRVAAFMDDPFFQYGWRKPDKVLNAIALEGIISDQIARSKAKLDLYTTWSDDITYGFSAVEVDWRVERGPQMVSRDFFGTRQKVVEESVLFEGNKLFPIDPYNALPDTSVPIQNVKDMQFFGGIERTNYYDLLEFERQEEDVFNVKYLKDSRFGRSVYYKADDQWTGRYDTTGINPNEQIYTSKYAKSIDVIWMYCKLIPAEFGLSDEEYPKIWKFGLAADRVIIYAKQLDNNHNRIPIVVTASNTDGHTVVPTSLLEIDFGIQHAVDWLWSSHVINVRKHLNNMLVVDPSLINMNDLMDTKYGMVARLRARAFGRGVKDAVMQLPVSDVTRTNIQDIGFLMGIEERVTAASDQMKGFQNRRGERVSASEARDTRIAGLSRMQKNAMLLAEQQIDLAYIMGCNTAQYMSEEAYVKTVGRWEQVLRAEYGITEPALRVHPDAIDMNWDVLPKSGALQGGEYANEWVQLMQLGQSHPELYQRIDYVRAWMHVARLLGAKNPQDFLKKAPNVRTMPQEQIENGVQQGNLVTPQQLQGAANYGG